MLIRIFLVFAITFLSVSLDATAQTQKPQPEKQTVDRKAAMKAKLQRNLQRSSTPNRYNPNMAHRAFADMMKDDSKDVFVINGYEVQINSNLSMESGKSLATIHLHSSGKKFGEIVFIGMNQVVETMQEKMSGRSSLEEDGQPVKLAYHIDMMPNILAFLDSNRSVAVVLDKATSQISLSSGKVNMWEKR